VGPRDGLGAFRKSRPSQDFDPRTVQPVASRHSINIKFFKLPVIRSICDFVGIL
jgi:hypothetical protein